MYVARYCWHVSPPNSHCKHMLCLARSQLYRRSMHWRWLLESPTYTCTRDCQRATENSPNTTCTMPPQSQAWKCLQGRCRLSSNPCTARGDLAHHPEDLSQTTVHPTEYQSRPWACLVELILLLPEWNRSLVLRHFNFEKSFVISTLKNKCNNKVSHTNTLYLQACSTGRFLLCVCQSCFSNTPAWISRCFYPLCRFWSFLFLLRWIQPPPCNPPP